MSCFSLCLLYTRKQKKWKKSKNATSKARQEQKANRKELFTMKNLFNIFNPDNKIANFLTKIMYLAWLNFLWLICSLPIITIGASTTAVYYTAMRMTRDDEGYIAKDFFHSFKENFLQATGVWLIVLAFFGMICFNWWNLSGSPNDLLRIASHLFLSLFVIFALISIYFFPLLSQFDMRIIELLRCSLFISQS